MNDPARALARGPAYVVLTALLCACAPRTTVILLPDKEDGKSTLVLKQDDREIVMDQPYAAVRQTWLGSRAYASTPQEVQQKFGPALSAQPSRPTKFTLYFVEGKDELSDESKSIVESVFAEIAKRPVPDIVVIGHTDSVGSDQVNDALARRRAETVRADLIRRGIAPENIQAIGRGKREPFVRRPDGVAEPANRRVEILVR
jgi:outer membrane protein OmpA-like peptidoglycan-associated protein